MRILSAAAAASLALAGPLAAQDHSGMDHSAHAQVNASLAAAIANTNRDEDRARDQHRHPAETLTFFQVEPGMKVGEYAPGGGWYSRLLGNYLGPNGQLVGLYFNPTKGPWNEASQQRIREGAGKFPAEVAGWSGQPAEKFASYTLDAAPEDAKGTFDRILVIRMMHNMMQWGIADTEIRAMRDLLKDDGMIGIVQHRAKADAPWSYANGSKGYVKQEDVVDFMRLNGFELVGASEVNANPQDTANHADGVWEMPPSLRTKREDLKDKGESDRMTLLFRKAQ